MMSFNPHEMECPCCQGRILSEKNAGNSERRVFILSDQCFPPLALANPAKDSASRSFELKVPPSGSSLVSTMTFSGKGNCMCQLVVQY